VRAVFRLRRLSEAKQERHGPSLLGLAGAAPGDSAGVGGRGAEEAAVEVAQEVDEGEPGASSRRVRYASGSLS
jgi:hypothetical protein